MIVCLGWGSLIWNLGGLPVEKLITRHDISPWARCAKKLGGEVGNWQPDGPKVKVEFLRQSGGNRLTLVLHKDAEPVCSFWARMTVSTPAAAVKKLGAREGIPLSKVRGRIGCWSNGDKDPENVLGLGLWASKQGVDHVIWTALGPKFRNREGVCPTEDEAVAHLDNLCGRERVQAKQYVRCAPRRIDTPYRRRIEHCLGWKPCE